MILDETQEQRDEELGELLAMPYDEVRKHEQLTPDALRIFAGEAPPKTEEKVIDLYREFPHLDFVAFLRTSMMTSVERRGSQLMQLLRRTRGKYCLDFGSGTGTHGIALAERGNKVAILDVPGRLFGFAKERYKRRGLAFDAYTNTQRLPPGVFDLVICTNVLEHVFSPVNELAKIHAALKRGGMLHLLVSTMVKNYSGHFKDNITKWVKSGPAYLKRHFIKIDATTFIKK